MSSFSLLLVLACVLFTCSSAQKSCKGHCGETYTRSNLCQCDYECLSHNECCKDFESLCTTKDSCKGRCGEGFKRGRQCNCDTDCLKYNQCCPDYETHCTLDNTALKQDSAADSPQRTTNLSLNVKCSKPTECSMEEETTEPEVTTSQTIPMDDVAPKADSEDYDPDPEESVTTDVSPLPEVTSGSEPLPSDTSEDKPLKPVEIKPSLLPDLPDVETEPNEDMKPTELAGKPEKDLPQTVSEPFSPPPPPEIASTWPATTQQPSDQPPEPTTPVQTTPPNTTPLPGKPDQNEETSSLETKATPATTVQPNNLHTDASKTTAELNPSNPVLPPDQAPAGDVPEPQPTEPHSKPSKAESHDTDPMDKPMDSVTQENIKDPFSNDLIITPSSVKSIPTTESPPPTKTPGKLTEPKSDANKDSDLTNSYSTTASPKKSSTTVNPSPTKVTEKPTKPKKDDKEDLGEGNSWDYQADANNDTNLCSGRPVNGLTTLRNGTVVVFRGHYFWTLDSRRKPGHPQAITDVWGIPSPIDTVYTRCNCQGKTYFFKGGNYWRFENDNMDPGFPKPVTAGFGLGGQITAALSMPQYRSRRESVFFFKKGGLAQRYTYRITPQCGSKLPVYAVRRKVKRQADPELGPEVDIRKTWTGFPSTVTSAVSMRSTGGDGYKYYIFSRTKYYSLKMEGNSPVILTPRNGPGKQKSAKSWFRCPENEIV